MTTPPPEEDRAAALPELSELEHVKKLKIEIEGLEEQIRSRKKVIKAWAAAVLGDLHDREASKQDPTLQNEIEILKQILT